MFLHLTTFLYLGIKKIDDKWPRNIDTSVSLLHLMHGVFNFA